MTGARRYVDKRSATPEVAAMFVHYTQLVMLATHSEKKIPDVCSIWTVHAAAFCFSSLHQVFGLNFFEADIRRTPEVSTPSLKATITTTKGRRKGAITLI